MTINSLAPLPNRSRGRFRRLGITAACVAALFTATVYAQAPVASGALAASAASPAELDQLVGRIALYPDDLIAIILPAATSPLQIVQADRFLDKRKTDPKLAIDDKWDDAVKSLLNYPDVVKSMSADLDWTSDLGEAVVTDQGAVLEAIQVFRRKTQSAGNLKSDPKQTVVVEKEVIKIVPADPQVIYVPQYNPSTVVVYGGYSSYGYYPAPYPSYYYPYAPGAAMAAGVIWGAAIGAAWSGNHYGANYGGGNNNINVNRNTNVNTGNINTGNVNRGGGSGGSSQWKSNKQPGQVSSSVGKTPSSGRAGAAGSGAGGGGFGGGGAGGGAGAGAGARPSTQPSGGGAFGGAGSSGRQTQMDSSRGASSRSSMSGGGGGSRSSSSMSGGGGGPRGGGGGGRGGGGGGGGGRRR